MRRKSIIIAKECVACGTCVKACPKQAVSIFKGVMAVWDGKRCVGCGRCVKACPAGIMMMREGEDDEKALV